VSVNNKDDINTFKNKIKMSNNNIPIKGLAYSFFLDGFKVFAYNTSPTMIVIKSILL
jgi:hypothetical protein